MSEDWCPNCGKDTIKAILSVDGVLSPDIGSLTHLNVCLRCGVVFLPKEFKTKLWNKHVEELED